MAQGEAVQGEAVENEIELPTNNQFQDVVQDVFERIWVPSSRLTDGPHVRAVFRPVVKQARQATVQVRCQRKRVALGGIVGPDGWILTKASRLKGPITCRLIDGRELDARLVGIDTELDLAMLKIEAKGLPFFNLEVDIDEKPRRGLPLAIQSSADTQDGDWVATVSAGLNPVAVGVVSVGPRSIRHRNGFLGIGYDEVYDQSESKGVKIAVVSEKSGADKAGLKIGDILLKVEDQVVEDMFELREIIVSYNPGDRIELTVKRGEEEMLFRAILSGQLPTERSERAYYQNSLGSTLSIRRGGFERALQHDTVLKPRDCGGPLVDLDGKLVGFNIARAGRTESYALPAELVRSRLYDLMSGRLAPSPSLED